MASLPQFYSHDYSITTDAYDFPLPMVAGGMWGGCSEEAFSLFNNNGYGSLDEFMLPESDITSSSSSTSSLSLSQSVTPSYPDQFIGVSDVPILPTVLPDLNDNYIGLWGNNNFPLTQNLGGGYQSDVQCDIQRECNEFIADYHPFCLDTITFGNWELKRSSTPSLEESNMKVGRYSVEERKDRILRYLRKRNQRNFNKTIKYACRKTLADRRVRVRGRFARNNEEEVTTKQNKNQQEGNTLYYGDTNQIKQDEDWLQEAIDSLMYLPYIAG